MQLAVENTRLRDRLADLDAIERDSEDRIAALRERIDEQIAEIEKLEALRRALAEAQRKLEAEKAERVDRLAYLRTRAEKAEAESRLAQEQVARLAANIQALKEQVKRLNRGAGGFGSEGRSRGNAGDRRASQQRARAQDRRVAPAPAPSSSASCARRWPARQLVQTEDDRFYLPAEVLFPSGSADLDRSGRRRVRRIGRALTDVAARIPDDVDWVLRVDGPHRPAVASQQVPLQDELGPVGRAGRCGGPAAGGSRRAGRTPGGHRFRGVPSARPGGHPGSLPTQPPDRVFADPEVTGLRRPIVAISGARQACGRTARVSSGRLRV